MFWVGVILLIAALIVWFCYNLATKGKVELKSIEACINNIERNPSYPNVYEKFIDVWNSSTWIQPDNFVNAGYYNRILKICEKNSSYLIVWQLLEEVIKKLDIYFAIDKSQKTNTFKFLADNLFKKINNQPIREQILLLIHLVSEIGQAETQELYNTSLKILEANSSSQEAKTLVLDVGRLHYGFLRPDKKPTIYDEQAIQNDIIVRST